MVVELFPVTFNLILIGPYICEVYTHYVSSKIQHFHNELITSGPPALRFVIHPIASVLLK